MGLQKTSILYLVVGIILIVLVKFIFRSYYHYSPLLDLLLNISPNLIGSFLLPFGAYTFFKKYFIFQTRHQVLLVCILGFCLVVVNELLQLIPFFKRTFDILDIVFSVLGISLGYIVFCKKMQQYPSQNLAKIN